MGEREVRREGGRGLCVNVQTDIWVLRSVIVDKRISLCVCRSGWGFFTGW